MKNARIAVSTSDLRGSAGEDSGRHWRLIRQCVRLLHVDRSRNVHVPFALAGKQPVAPANRGGFSLFEVVISLAIFAASAAAIGQLVFSGVRSSVRTKLQTEAVIRCESKMAEVIAGITPMTVTTNGAYPEDNAWTWSLGVQPGPYPDLYVVEVTVSHPGSNRMNDVSYSLFRLIRDPAVTTEMLQQDAQQAAKTSTTSSSTSATGGGR